MQHVYNILQIITFSFVNMAFCSRVIPHWDGCPKRNLLGQLLHLQ